MSLATRKSGDAIKCENELLRIVEGDPGLRLRSVIREGEKQFDPQMVRKSIWTLIDDHRVVLDPDNHLYV